jgi:hypothetical protein
MDTDVDLKRTDAKELVQKLQRVMKVHASNARISSGAADDDLSQITERSVLPTTLEFSGTTDDGKWLEKPQSFENILATANVMKIGSESKLPKTKLTDVFLPDGICMEPPVVSNALLEKVRLASSAPNLHSKSLLEGVSIASSITKKSKKSSKRTDPLASSKVKHSKRSLSTINIRAKDSKAEKIIQLMAQSYSGPS